MAELFHVSWCWSVLAPKVHADFCIGKAQKSFRRVDISTVTTQTYAERSSVIIAADNSLDDILVRLVLPIVGSFRR